MMYKNLKTIRHDAGLKQTDISSRLSVSVPTVYKWEKGRAPVARKHWTELAELLRVSVDELEKALVQTLLDSCRERGNTEALKNAASSSRYPGTEIEFSGTGRITRTISVSGGRSRRF